MKKFYLIATIRDRDGYLVGKYYRSIVGSTIYDNGFYVRYSSDGYESYNGNTATQLFGEDSFKHSSDRSVSSRIIFV